MEKDDDGVAEVFINGDTLASIFACLPLLDLISASHVSKSWNRAVFFSLRRFTAMPWLLIYRQTSFPPYTMAATVTAYDPWADKWIYLKIGSPLEHVAAIRSSHSTLLYVLSPARFSFSVDTFHLEWRHVAPPRLWRVDPVVVFVGRRVIVAGGVCDFEDDRLAVELLDIETGLWERCESMPDSLWGSASSTWLSVAVYLKKLFVTEKKSGVACCFDPETRSWTQLDDLCPLSDCKVYSRVIGFAGDYLIVAGITGDEDNPLGIKFWKVSNESPWKFELIGSMPKEYLDKLREIGSCWPLTSITLNAVGDMVFIHNDTDAGEIVAAEMVGGELCKWRTLPNANAAVTWNRGQTAEGLIVTCSNVDFSDLKRAVRDNVSYSVIS